MKLWPHQERAIAQIKDAIEKNVHSCVVAPPGAGKSLMMRHITREQLEQGKRVAIFVHRQALMDQTIETFKREGIPFGVVAAGYSKLHDPWKSVQLCSIQTVHSRKRRHTFEFPWADTVMIDEAHQQTESMARGVFYGDENHEGYVKNGATLIGFTATPVNLAGMYRKLIIAATYQELRECKAHLPVYTYGSRQVDLRGLKTNKDGEFSQKQLSRIMQAKTIFGDVWYEWEKHNPDALPAILFAPGVGESKFFVNHFYARGVAAAHIDGKDCYWTEWTLENGKRVLKKRTAETNSELREMILQRSKEGYFKVICNRFVLREAIDMPWLYHGIFATAFGSIASYLQSVGRIQRYHPDYDHVLMTDHGGNFSRHNSPNMHRFWRLGDTAQSILRESIKRKQKSDAYDAEPITCECGAVRRTGRTCHACGAFWPGYSIRHVRQLNGKLREMRGRDVPYEAPPPANKVFTSALYAAERRKGSVKQAMIIFRAKVREKGWPYDLADVTQYKIPAWNSFEANQRVSEVYYWIRDRFPQKQGAKRYGR